MAEDMAAPVRAATAIAKVEDRTRFVVEIRPGETTIVSWKKLVKDASRSSTSSAVVAAAASTTTAADDTPAATIPSLESRLAPGQPVADELKDASQPNRFSAVIEKIERLYMGKDSDEEDVNDIPDDDQYDTEDSFIDDAELDEYFEVDKLKTKHDGYFVNRGALEKVEPVELINQQPKKRRRKQTAIVPDGNDLINQPNKHLKVGRKRAGNLASSVEKNMLYTTQGPPVKNLEEMKIQSHSNISETYHEKVAGDDGKPLLDLSRSLLISNGNLASFLPEGNDEQKTGLLPAKNPSSNFKEKDKSGMRENIDLNLPDGKHSLQSVKTSIVHKREGSSLKPKANSLEKAIRELEKIVAESRPPAIDANDADASSYVKRRLPREIKLKLAKVARLANSSNGKVSNEILNRLMGIMGHLCQMRTLKRHLKIMMNTSLSAKQEKDDKFQQIKKEVIELIKAHAPSLISKGAEPQMGGCGDQESGNSDKALKPQLSMDATLEDKICTLYDIFVDGLDEGAAPQVRKLYAELAELWPRGVMDNHGIKRAICRAKERKKSLNEKHKEKIKKKVVATKTEDIVHVESSSLAQLQRELRFATDPDAAAVAQHSRLISSTSSAMATAFSPANISIVSTPFPSTDVPNFEQSKHKKVKGTPDSSMTDGRVVDGMVVKKKPKKRTEVSGGGLLRPDKLLSQQGDGRQKQHNHAAAPVQGSLYKSSYDES